MFRLAKLLAKILVTPNHVTDTKDDGYKNYFQHDNGKAPMNNPPKSAILSEQTFNLFFSSNKAVVEDDCVLRRIYGYLTAHVTGLDQRYARVYPPPPPMSEMMNLIQAALLRSGYDLKGLDIDMVTCKVYYTYFDVERQVWETKVLNSHTDVKYRPDGSVV